MFFVSGSRTRRMHTVPASYFEAFDVQEPARRRPGVWRFDRITGGSRLLGVRDAEIAKDLYTVFSDDGSPDTGIEDRILCGIEGEFCAARDLLLQREPLTKQNWSGLFRFIAAQLLRTPRFFQLMRDGLAADGTLYKEDTLPRVMLLLIERWIPRLARMNGMLAYNEIGVPLLTCDNPAVAWKKSGDGFICGVDQYDPELIVSCPVSPGLLFVAYQTHESLKAVHNELQDHPRADRRPQKFNSAVDIGSLPEFEVMRLNHVCVSNAHRYVYASYRDESLLRFLRDRFFGAPAPVRRRDLQPIGSPVIGQ